MLLGNLALAPSEHEASTIGKKLPNARPPRACAQSNTFRTPFSTSEIRGQTPLMRLMQGKYH